MTIKERIYAFIEFKDMSVKKFEELCDLSNGYISSMRKGFGRDKLNNVLTIFPDLNRDWLLYGEGEMIKSNNTIINSPVGNNSTQIAGNSNSINCYSLNKAIDEISEQRKLVSKSQEQIDRLLAIIEKMQKL